MMTINSNAVANMVFAKLHDNVIYRLHTFRVVVDGEGSRTVFNGQEMMTDIQFTRISNYISG